VLRKSEVRQPQVCDHCGGRFGLLTHRWWSNKFCKKKCKDAHCVNLHSAETKFVAGTASFLREGLHVPHESLSRNRAHVASA
jgi:hypothetical protein